MKTIFEKIKGREWDYSDSEFMWEQPNDLKKTSICLGGKERLWYFSLADLLANKSWCKAVWQESKHIPIMWTMRSRTAFVKLQQEGEEACLKYIKETMI